MNFRVYINYVLNLKNKNGYSLIKIIDYTVEHIIKLNLDNDVLIDNLIKLSNIEYNISNLGLERNQIYSFAAVLYQINLLNII